MQKTIALPANSEPWLQYAIRLNLLNEKCDDLIEIRKKVIADTKIQALLDDVNNFHSTLVNSHKNPDLPIHKLLFLLDIGFDQTVPEIHNAINEIMKHRDQNGIYQSFINVPKHFGGSGEDTFGWAMCDAPLLLYALRRAGVDYEKHIRQGVDYLAGLFQQGYPCVVSRELGKFRGPGRKEDCCPYATLIMLKLFSEIPEYRESELAQKTVQVLLSLWENSMQRHPYMFYMGTDFRKLKAPSLWYDIISVTDVLSRFDCAKQDKRFLDMLAIIKEKQNEDGQFVPESIYKKFIGWDFGQKKAYSPYLSYLYARIRQRVES